MSRIFLPNGGAIEIHNQGWMQTNYDGGNTVYNVKNADGTTTFLGTITVSGIVHLTEACRYTYYPPPITNLDDCVKEIFTSMKLLKPWQLKKLKNELRSYNAKTGYWK